MKIKSEIFRKKIPRIPPESVTCFCNSPSITPSSMEFCSETLHELFDFPQSAQEIQFVAHDRPVPNSIVVRLRSAKSLPTIEGSYGTTTYIQDDYIERLLGKGTWHVCLYYWE